MDQEITSIRKNETWTLYQLLEGARKIIVNWVFKTKFNEQGVLKSSRDWLLRTMLRSKGNVTMRYLLLYQD